MDVKNSIIVVTGASGLLGQRLLPLLDRDERVGRIVGLDVRDPARRVAKLDFRRADLPGGDLEPLLDGADVVVHLAAHRDPLPDERLTQRINVGGTRRLLAAARATGVSKLVWVSSAAVYGAHDDNPVPLTEDAVLRPNAGFVPAAQDAECERLLSTWGAEQSDATCVVLRMAPVLGPGRVSLLARAAVGGAAVGIREAGSRPVQVVSVDDAASAILLAALEPLEGVYNVAADSWLSAEDAASLVGHRPRPALPPEVAQRTLAALWSTGLGDAPPAVVPYLRHPFVIANDRLKAAGWIPRHTNEEAMLLSSEQPESSAVGWIAATGAIVAGAVAATMWMRSRRRRA